MLIFNITVKIPLNPTGGNQASLMDTQKALHQIMKDGYKFRKNAIRFLSETLPDVKFNLIIFDIIKETQCVISVLPPEIRATL